MYKYNKPTQTSISTDKSYVGETIEQKINRIVNNKEPIKDGAPIIYTDRKDGVKPEYDVRTDRFELAVDIMDKGAKSHQARRENKIGEEAKKGMEAEKKGEQTKDGGADSTGTTDSKT